MLPFASRASGVVRSQFLLIAAASPIVVVAIAACAAAKPQAVNCEAAPRDSIFAAAGPVYHDCAVDTKAKLTTTNVRIDFRPSTPRASCSTAEIEFVVGTNGKPETATAMTVHTNDQPFADAMIATLGDWRYEPALRGGVAVRQIVQEKRIASSVLMRVQPGSVPHPPDRPPTC